MKPNIYQSKMQQNKTKELWGYPIFKITKKTDLQTTFNTIVHICFRFVPRFSFGALYAPFLEPLGLCVNTHGKTQVSIDIHGYPYPCQLIHGYPWSPGIAQMWATTSSVAHDGSVFSHLFCNSFCYFLQFIAIQFSRMIPKLSLDDHGMFPK